MSTTPTRPAASLLLTLPLLLASTPAPASDDAAGLDWPQWRGPARTGVSVESGWDPAGTPTPLWTTDLGLGHSSFAVSAGRVYTLGYDAEAGLDRVYCLDAATGEEHWRHEYAAEIWDNAHDGGTLTTPTVVDDVVYTSNREGKVFCFDADDGAVRWSRDLAADLGLEPPTWGFSASPLVVDDRVYLNVGRVVALDRGTGADAWATEKGYGNAYSTPAPFEHDGRGCLAVLNGDGLAVLARADGSELAFHPWVKNPQIYPMTPVVTGDRIFISAGYNRGCVMARFTGDGLEEVWAGRVMRNKMTGCVLWEGHLYGFDESILKCIDLDGKEQWRQRGLGTGSMSIAGGRLVILDGKGQVIIAEARPDAYVELSRHDVFEEGTAWSTPVLSHGRVYCRSSRGPMACLDYSGAAGTTGSVAAAAGGTGEPSGALPDAEAIVARHVEAIGGRASAARVTSVRLEGTTESLVNTVRTGTVEMHWAAGRGFSWREDTGFEWGHHAETGWHVGLRSNPRAVEGDELDALREAGDVTRVLDPDAHYASMRTTGATVFDNRECYVVEATSAAGHRRTLYFEVESGLYAGHDGDGIHMWTVSDYRDFDGVMLPARWAFYEPVKGEMTAAAFETVTVNGAVDAGRFEVPEMVRLFTRSPEQIAIDNARLAEAHAAILGTWRAEEDESRPSFIFDVRDGFVAMTRGDDEEEDEPDYLTEPDEQGVFSIIGAAYVTFTPETGESGAIEAILIHVGGEQRVRLVREAK
jgi:outer membrane protein assembly factor BamB